MAKTLESPDTENLEPANGKPRTDRQPIQGLQHEGKPLVEIDPGHFKTENGEIVFTAVEVLRALNHKAMLSFMSCFQPEGNQNVTEEITALLNAPALLEDKDGLNRLFLAEAKNTNDGETENQENQSSQEQRLEKLEIKVGERYGSADVDLEIEILEVVTGEDGQPRQAKALIVDASHHWRTRPVEDRFLPGEILTLHESRDCWNLDKKKPWVHLFRDLEGKIRFEHYR